MSKLELASDLFYCWQEEEDQQLLKTHPGMVRPCEARSVASHWTCCHCRWGKEVSPPWHRWEREPLRERLKRSAWPCHQSDTHPFTPCEANLTSQQLSSQHKNLSSKSGKFNLPQSIHPSSFCQLSTVHQNPLWYWAIFTAFFLLTEPLVWSANWWNIRQMLLVKF